MSFPDALLSDLADADEFQRWRKEREGRKGRTIDPADARAVGLLGTEILHVGAIISVVTSVLNALESDVFPKLSVESACAFEPQLSAAFIEKTGELAGRGLFVSTDLAARELLAHLNISRQLTYALMRSPHDLDPSQSIVPIAVVADSWRRVCLTALGVYRSIAEESRKANPALPTEAEMGTLDLLHSAARCGWPCITKDGQITIPGWAERRREKRVELNKPMSIILGSERIPAIMTNLTSTGFGVETTYNTTKGAWIEVETHEGRFLCGIVRWVDGGLFGVRLADPLRCDDALLSP